MIKKIRFLFAFLLISNFVWAIYNIIEVYTQEPTNISAYDANTDKMFYEVVLSVCFIISFFIVLIEIIIEKIIYKFQSGRFKPMIDE